MSDAGMDIHIVQEVVSMFTAKITKVVELQDGEENVLVTIRKLSAKSLDKAKEARQIAAANLTSKFGLETIRAFRESRAEKNETESAQSADEPTTRYSQYDRDTTLVQGVVSWTAKVPLREGIDDLDEESAERLFHEIIDLSDPAPTVNEEKVKNV